jgi:hypothetical protein
MKTQRRSGRKQAGVEVVPPAAAPSSQTYGSVLNGHFVFDDSVPIMMPKLRDDTIALAQPLKTSANS